MALLLVGALGSRSRLAVLLSASVAAYLWLAPARAIVAVAVMVLVTHVAGMGLEANRGETQRRAALWVGIALNLLALLGARFWDGLQGLLAGSGGAGGAAAGAAVGALGASYVVLQAIAYLVDCYIGAAEPGRSPGSLGLYLLFFPKVVQGPIERWGPLLSQLEGGRPPAASDVSAGLVRMAWGLFKKLVVADRLGGYVEAVYGNVGAFGGLAHAAATYLFAFQLYADFSGYTDLALGGSRVLGLRLAENFDRPFQATSVAEFWRRWHISLSRWLQDYVFTPLQLAWRGWPRLGTPSALLATFLVSGAWHGMTWNFLVWGLLHGTFVATGLLLGPAAARVRRRLGLSGSRTLRAWDILVTFHLVTFTWIFFRARSLDDALQVVRSLGTDSRGLAGLALAQGQREALITACLLLAVGVGAAIRWSRGDGGAPRAWEGFARAEGAAARWAQYYALLLATLVLGRFGSSAFIYAGF
ncbi:MAG: MBOAT family protein [Anaeromyxobacter sp.]|nr:MBOAT family protein [Anaeromyxobacter sp.]